MTIELLSKALLWSTVINIGLLLWWVLIFFFARVILFTACMAAGSNSPKKCSTPFTMRVWPSIKSVSSYSILYPGSH